MRDKDIEGQLRGKTLKVYRYLLERADEKVGVREIQRKLNFSSPSLAAYHLEKLVSLGLVGKTNGGEYFLVQNVKVGVMKFFVKFGRFLIPRFIFYAVFITSMLITYILLYKHDWSIHNIVAIIFGTISSAILWAESIKLIIENRSKM
ncbi:MAG: hypothetical protein NZ922_02355 [Candidatus Methanomethyliaceae archaeon]|nr:hypothetical protein [Candidatus Methanomethyliaceae archaeon]MDW7970994.1 ArsR family transcriptional regulator [Nitrososphaerota archaeon]